jgi:SNF2 family DNA or RNA helicase
MLLLLLLLLLLLQALVFTQYNSTLEWLKKALPAAGFGYRSISGSMPLNQRTKAIENFQRDPPTTGERGVVVFCFCGCKQQQPSYCSTRILPMQPANHM